MSIPTIPAAYLLTVPVSFFAGLTQGLTGFGSALVAMPFFVEVLPPKQAVTLSVLNGLLITSILTYRHRNDIHLQNLSPLIMGAIPGVFLGIGFLKYSDEQLIRHLLGGIVLSYSLYSLFKKNPVKRREIPRPWGVTAGFLTGLIGASFNAGGPPTIIYVTLTGWKKDEMKGTLSAFFLVTGLMISTGHFTTGLSNKTTFCLYLLNAPVVIVGVVAGMRAYSRVSAHIYLRIVLILLLAMGTILLLR